MDASTRRRRRPGAGSCPPACVERCCAPGARVLAMRAPRPGAGIADRGAGGERGGACAELTLSPDGRGPRPSRVGCALERPESW